MKDCEGKIIMLGKKITCGSQSHYLKFSQNTQRTKFEMFENHTKV